jgi:hypothetical protein
MIAVPPECVEKKGHKGAKLVCEERGRKMVFHNPNGNALDKIRVDGCVIKSKKACDYLVRDSKSGKYFVELKGGHVHDAFEQFNAAIPHFIEANSEDTFWCFVVCSGTPPATTPGEQASRLRFSRKWKSAEVKIQTNLCEHTIK